MESRKHQARDKKSFSLKFYITVNYITFHSERATKIIINMFCLLALSSKTKSVPGQQRKQVPISVAIEKLELMDECFPKHLCTVTARMKENKETDEKDKRKRVKFKKSKVGIK